MSLNIESILQNLSLDEKVSLLAGKNFWETVAVPSKGVPSIKTSDGPNGARGEVFSGGTKAACFPAAVCSAATWNPELSKRVGTALAEEAKTKGARILLGPTMCNHRHPLGGRNFESFSEDPYLAGKLAAQVCIGLQEKGVGATIKHFVGNEQETQRTTVNEIISERALREIYMKPFEICVKEAEPWAVMTSYNKINGTHADAHANLLQQVLRGEWGWEGLVMSDWGGTTSTVDSLNAGLDLEMPGPARQRKIDAVTEAVNSGLVSTATINERCRNVLELLEKVGAFDDPDMPPETSVDNPAHRQLIREVAGEGITLLMNENSILPLQKDKLKGKKIALLGLAKEALIHGGGSASLNAHYRISPWEGLKSYFGDDVELEYAQGAHTYRQLPPMREHVKDLDGATGWTLEYFKKGETKAPVKTINEYPASEFSPLLAQDARWKDLRLSATYTPTESGSHYLSCSGMGPTVVSIDDKVIFEQKSTSPDPMAFIFGGVPEEEFTFEFTEGKSYKICLLSRPPKSEGILDGSPGFRVGFMTQRKHDQDLLSEAVQLARESEVAIVFTGHTPAWETEGQDQLSFNLPADGSQDKLVEAVAAANSRTIVVNSTGVPVAMPWAEKVQGLLQAWFPGQEAGNAIADVLCGVVNPSGRLPVSFPRSIEDSPAHGNFPGDTDENGRLTVKYDEGVFVGYRHYDRLPQEKMLFPFGFGLSYTTFSLQNGQISQDSRESFKASVAVSNTSDMPGSTVVQLYVGRSQSSSEHPIKVLAAFRKIHLKPGEQRIIDLTVALKDFAYFDEGIKAWKVEKGQYNFSFGQSTAAIESVVSVEIGEPRVLKL